VQSHFEDALAFWRTAGYRPAPAWTCHDDSNMLLAGNPDRDRSRPLKLLDESRVQNRIGQPVVSLRKYSYPDTR